ncbi:SDR family oxidoreductase [Curtobacterium sp. MCBD17_040]|uniref:SDR family oxidoreductase n=1 Tax=Curtobacterium sp. MCBD17_040 TaxID=2175674 RepID=UPI000DAA0A17
MTRAWAAEFAGTGVRVSTVAPGATATPGNADSSELLAAMTEGTPAGVPVRRWTSRSPSAGWPRTRACCVNGGTLDVDGGIASTRLRG